MQKSRSPYFSEGAQGFQIRIFNHSDSNGTTFISVTPLFPQIFNIFFEIVKNLVLPVNLSLKLNKKKSFQVKVRNNIKDLNEHTLFHT